MKIVSWNVNGLRSIVSKNFYEFVEKENPDILCVQEIRADAAAVSSLDIPFKYKYFHCAEKAGYSGVAIFSNTEPKNVDKTPLCGSPDEGRFISADFGDYVLTAIYAPNSQAELKRLAYKHEWNGALAKRLSARKKNIICGDFNVAHNPVDIARPAENENNAGYTATERADFGKIMDSLELVDIWRERNPDTAAYSWWSYWGGARRNNVGWRIDYFLVSKTLAASVSDAKILTEVKGSDHAPLSLEI